MDMTTEIPRVVVHFAHRDFKRCRIMDGHLAVIIILNVRHWPNNILKLDS